jgi:5'-nucleotidase
MKILVSNDDGIQAKGIRTLIEHLSRQHDVYVVAPDQERSAMGHALTLHQPIRVVEEVMPYPVKEAYSISGTPSDCVKLALTTLIKDEIDWVISGINHGPNLGADVMYSGTVSAALEGAVFDKPSIAISLMNGHAKNANFHGPAEFITRYFKTLQKLTLPPKTIINVNFPAVELEYVAGVKVSKLGLRMYSDSYERRVDPRGGQYFWLAGEIVNHTGVDYEDVEAIRNNYVTMTPVRLDMTNHTYCEALRPLLDETFTAPFGTGNPPGA